MAAGGRSYGSVEIGRVAAALLVVYIHTGPLYVILPELNAVLAHGVGRLAVPFFFIVTGYFGGAAMIDDGPRWARRIFAMYLVWSLVYAPLWLIKLPDAATVFGNLVVGFRHLWYLPALLLGALAMGWAAPRLGMRRLVLLSVALYCLGTAVQYGLNTRWDWDALPAQDLYAQIPRNFLTFALPFLVMGHAIRESGAADRLCARPGSAVALVLLAVLAFAAEFTITQRWFGSNRMTDMYFSLILLVPVLFACLLRLPTRAIALPLGKVASSVYFTHIYLIAIGNTVLQLGPVGVYVFACLVGIALTPLLIRMSRRSPFV